MNEATVPTRRIRINVSTSVKGIKTYDATIELTELFYPEAWSEAFRQRVLLEHDALIAELDRRYPALTA